VDVHTKTANEHCASKKGISTRQIQRMLNCSMKTAWFLIRLAMDPCSATPNDVQRAEIASKGVKDKRLTCETIRREARV
jgi:orotate phosphoribosyltransferase-like protein